jgi:hypothetical protein
MMDEWLMVTNISKGMKSMDFMSGLLRLKKTHPQDLQDYESTLMTLSWCIFSEILEKKYTKSPYKEARISLETEYLGHERNSKRYRNGQLRKQTP